MPKKNKTGTGKKNAIKKRAAPLAAGRETRFREDRVNDLNMLVLAALASIIIVGPFFYGLFYEKHLLVLHITSFTLFILWWLTGFVREDLYFLRSPLDWFVLFFALFYLLSVCGAVNTRAALGEFFKVANYAALYFVAADICRRSGTFGDKTVPGLEPGAGAKDTNTSGTGKRVGEGGENKGPFGKAPGRLPVVPGKRPAAGEAQIPLSRLFFFILVLSGVVLSVAGLGAAAGSWDPGISYMHGRITTPLGYANTAAAYVMSSYFLLLGLAFTGGRPGLRPLYLFFCAPLLLTFVFTYSRGAWVFFPLFALLFVVLARPGSRVAVMLYMVSGLALLPFLAPLNSAFEQEASFQAWLYIILCAILMVCCGFAADFANRFNLKVKLAFSGLVLILVISAGAYYLAGQLSGPAGLSLPAGSDPRERFIEHRVGSLSGGETFTLYLDIEAGDPGSNREDRPEYAWRLEALAYDLDDNLSELLVQKGGDTAGIKSKQFSFTSDPGHHRLEIRLYNRYPGTWFALHRAELEYNGSASGLNFAFSRLLPTTVYEGIFSRATSFDLRLAHNRDALKIIGDHFLMGVGGGGWEALYRSYQDQKYTTTEVHNHFLQVWIEAGLLGFVSFTAIWVFFAAAYFLNRFKQNPAGPECDMWAASLVAVFALGAHSAIDWNLSYGSVAVFLFILFAAAGSFDRNEWFARKPVLNAFTNRLPRRGRFPVLLAALLLLTCAVVLKIGLEHAENGLVHYQDGNLSSAGEHFLQAATLDPFRADSHYYLSFIAEDHLDVTADPRHGKEMLRRSRRAYELEPYNPDYIQRFGGVLVSLGRTADGLDILTEVIAVRPFDQSAYRYYADIVLQVSELYLDRDLIGEAETFLLRLFALEKLMVEKTGSAEAIYYHLGGARYLLGDDTGARIYLEDVSPGDYNYEDARRLLEMIGE